MKKLALIVALLLCSSPAFAGDRFTLSGYLKNELSLRAEGFNSDLTKFKNIIQLAGEYKIKDDELVFFTKMKYWYDAAFDWRDKYDMGQDGAGHVQRTDWLRDCYLDYNRDSWFLRLGKQQVAWGQADGVTVLDRVNPFDLTEYWLQDFEDMRIPLWMANINYAPKLNSNLQFLVIPDFEQSTSAPLYAPFTTYSYIRYEDWRKAQAGVDQQIYFPAQKFENSTFAFQWSDRIGDLDYTLNYLNGFYYSARNYTITKTGTGGPGSTFQVTRTFKRYEVYGSSFNKSVTNPGPLQGFTFRGDFGYYRDEPIYYGDPLIASSSGIKRWDNIMWILGADKTIFTKLSISGQFGQYILQHSKPNGPTARRNFILHPFTYGSMDPVENIFTFKVSTNFMNDRLKAEVAWSGTDDPQGKLSPKVSYELRDNLLLTLGLHYFYGSLMDANGQYRDQSQIYSQIKYSF